MAQDKQCPKRELRHSAAYLCISQLKMLGSVHANRVWDSPCFESTSRSSALMWDWLRLHAAVWHCLFACLRRQNRCCVASGLLLNVVAWLSESAAEHGFVIRPFVLLPNFFCGISSCQLSSPAHPFACTDPCNPPCIWRLCQTLRRMKTIVLVCVRRQNLRLRHAFSPQQKLRWQSRQTDFLLPLLLCLFFQIGSESSVTKWLRTLISLTHRWRKGPRPRHWLLKTRWNRL